MYYQSMSMLRVTLFSPRGYFLLCFGYKQGVKLWVCYVESQTPSKQMFSVLTGTNYSKGDLTAMREKEREGALQRSGG